MDGRGKCAWIIRKLRSSDCSPGNATCTAHVHETRAFLMIGRMREFMLEKK